MDKGYYVKATSMYRLYEDKSQSTIKMDKGYYGYRVIEGQGRDNVAIHNKNG